MATAQEYISGLLRKNQSGGMNKYSPTPNMTSVKTGKPAVGSITSAPSASPIKSAAITPPQSPSTSTYSPVLSSAPAQTYMSNYGSTGTQTSTGDSTAGTTAVSKPAESEYLKYMRSIFNPQELDRAQKQKESYNKQVLEASKRLGEIRTNQLGTGLEGREAQEARLDLPGGTTAGATQAANMIGRRTNAELARLGVQEAGAAASLSALTGAQEQANNVFEQMLNAGATVFEAEQAALEAEREAQGEGFTLGKDQVRYDAEGNIIASGIGSSGAGGGIYSAGTDPIADSWVEYVKSGGKITDVPDEYQNAVAQARANAPIEISDTSKTAMSLIDTLLADDASLKSITGVFQGAGGIFPLAQLPGTPGALTENQYNQLKSILSLENRSLLKGSGAISDYEFKVLEKASSAMGRNLSEEQLRKVLTDLRSELSGEKPIPTNPKEGDVWKAPDKTEYEYRNGAWESFSKVGNTSASIPASSRLASVNNNPGNLRYAGQEGAVQGEGGFAKFSTPQAGVAALQRQIQLDASRGLTLAQFINKYAPPTENDTQKYIQDVLAMTGAQPNTPISQINLTSLTRAIAKKESGTVIA